MVDASKHLIKGLVLGVVIQVVKLMWMQTGMYALYPNISIYQMKDCVFGDKDTCSLIKGDLTKLFTDKEALEKESLYF